METEAQTVAAELDQVIRRYQQAERAAVDGRIVNTVEWGVAQRIRLIRIDQLEADLRRLENEDGAQETMV